MTGDAWPSDDHVSRYCKPSAVGAAGRPLAAAFELRSKDDYPSVNWLGRVARGNFTPGPSHNRA